MDRTFAHRRGWRRALLCALASLSVTGSAGAAESPRLPECANTALGGAVTPAAWSPGCVGASLAVSGLTWTGWGTAVAIATGVEDVKVCNPDCISGPTLTYSTQVRATTIRRCASPHGLALYYTEITVTTTFPPGNMAGEPPGDRAARFTAHCLPAHTRVSVHGSLRSFGAFEDTGENAGTQLSSMFGPPSSVRRRTPWCTLRWGGLGLAVNLGKSDGQLGDPCEVGYFLEASMTSRRWRTANGIGPGVSASRAAQVRKRACTKSLCGVTGYALQLQRGGCDNRTFSVVAAETRGGRVNRLIVRSLNCLYS